MVFLHVSYFFIVVKRVQCTFKCVQYKSTIFYRNFVLVLIVWKLCILMLPSSWQTKLRVCFEIMKFTSFRKADTDGFFPKSNHYEFYMFHTIECAAFGCDGESWCTKNTHKDTYSHTCIYNISECIDMHIYWNRMIKCVCVSVFFCSQVGSL